MSTFSVTEVRNALRCPRLFALGRMRKAPVAFPIGSSCLGATFHRLVDRFARTVESPPAHVRALPVTGAALDAVEAELRCWLLDLLVTELETDANLSTMPSEVDDLAQALRELARHLAGRLRRFPGPPADALRQLVRESERHVEAVLDDGVLLRGTLDALYGDPDGSLEVIEYKLTDEANDAVDRAQVALYSHMLAATTGQKPRAAVLRFMPVLRETSIAASEAQTLVDGTLRPLVRNMVRWEEAPDSAPATDRRDLCPACPLAEPCAERYADRLPPRDDPPANATRPRVDVLGIVGGPTAPPATTPRALDDEGRQLAERVRDFLVKDLKRLGVNAVCPRTPLVGPTLLEVELSVPRGPIKQLDQRADDLKHRLATTDSIDVEYEKRGARRVFVVTRPVARKVLLSDLLTQDREYLGAEAGRCVLGQRQTGEVLHADLADSSTPHLLIGGTTGSGKSVLLRGIVASLVHYHPPAAIRFTLIDPKRVTFNVPSFMSAVSTHLDGPIGYDVEDAVPVIDRLIEVMEERYALFEKAKVGDLREYNELVAAAERLERRVLVIDEFQDLTADKESEKLFSNGVKRLGAKARAAGVHLILATQRPDRSVVPPLLKTNLPGRIALRVQSLTNSRIILDQGGAEKLLGKGDLLADLGHGLVRAQAPLVQ